jgi:hypothetical protein
MAQNIAAKKEARKFEEKAHLANHWGTQHGTGTPSGLSRKARRQMMKAMKKAQEKDEDKKKKMGKKNEVADEDETVDETTRYRINETITSFLIGEVMGLPAEVVLNMTEEKREEAIYHLTTLVKSGEVLRALEVLQKQTDDLNAICAAVIGAPPSR